jgi:hypothetical protein
VGPHSVPIRMVNARNLAGWGQSVGPEYSSHGKALIYPSDASMLDHRSIASPVEAMRMSSPRRRSFVGMLPVIHALLAFMASLFRSRRSLHLKVLALQHQVAVYQHSGCRPYFPTRVIACSGPGSRVSGQDGRTRWFSSNHVRSSPGSGNGSGSTGGD